MSAETIFFSYSRNDTEFVLRLAKDLRKAGANIWLDQLDIKPGTRWDSSIEKALKSSTSLLVILSNTSVASQNVLDEVSYTLEQSKSVVPVLMEECEIPFRLKRLQYADFSTDYQKGLKTLAEALNLDYDTAEKLTEGAVQSGQTTTDENPKIVAKIPSEAKKKAIAIPENKASKTIQTEKKPGHIATPPTTKTKANSKMLWYAIAGVALVAALWFLGIFVSIDQQTLPDKTSDKITTATGTTGTNELEPPQEEAPKNDIPEKKGAKTPEKSPENIPTNTPDILINTPTNSEPPKEKIPVTELVVNAFNVQLVQYTNGEVDPSGYFKYLGNNIWEEQSLIHDHITPFEETHRDEWTIYLIDRTRDMTINLNLYRREIALNEGKPDGNILYAISDAKSEY